MRLIYLLSLIHSFALSSSLERERDERERERERERVWVCVSESVRGRIHPRAVWGLREIGDVFGYVD